MLDVVTRKWVTREDIKDIIAVMVTKGLSKSTVANTIAPVKEMLNHAVDDGVLSGNPAARIGRFLRRTKDRRADVNPLTREEVACLLDAAQQHVPQYYPLFLCAVRTGMRMGELLGLQWGDIDFHSRFIEVHRAIVWGKSCRRKRQIRRVDMSQQLTDTLKGLWVRRREETLQKGWGEVPEWIFVNEGGRLLDLNNVRKRVFSSLLREGWHTARALPMICAIPSPRCSSPRTSRRRKSRTLLGDHSIQVTMDIYGHLYAEENRKVVDSLDDVPAGQGNTTKRNPRATGLSSATGNRMGYLIENIGADGRNRTADLLITSIVSTTRMFSKVLSRKPFSTLCDTPFQSYSLITRS